MTTQEEEQQKLGPCTFCGGESVDSFRLTLWGQEGIVYVCLEHWKELTK